MLVEIDVLTKKLLILTKIITGIDDNIQVKPKGSFDF